MSRPVIPATSGAKGPAALATLPSRKADEGAAPKPRWLDRSVRPWQPAARVGLWKVMVYNGFGSLARIADRGYS